MIFNSPQLINTKTEDEINVGLQVNDVDINPLIACTYSTNETLNLHAGFNLV